MKESKARELVGMAENHITEKAIDRFKDIELAENGKVTVVIGIYQGVFEDIRVFGNGDKANEVADKIIEDYGLNDGRENLEESVVHIFEVGIE